MAAASGVLARQVHPRRAFRNGGERPRVRLGIAVPGLALYTMFVIYPSLSAVVDSFRSSKGVGTSGRFIGLANYSAVLSSSIERQALVHTLEATLVIVIGSNLLGLGLALALRESTKLNYLLRLLWFLPAALPGIIAGFIWTFLYSPQGPIATIWQAIAPGSVPPAFLGSPTEALWCIVAIAIWQSSGYSMIILLSGLQSIGREVLEAAKVDGASAFQRVRFVMLPLLRPALTVSTILAVVSGMLLFDAVMATTDGGPGYATETLATQLYKQAFLFNRFGFGMAMGVLMAVAILAIVGMLSWAMNRRALGV